MWSPGEKGSCYTQHHKAFDTVNVLEPRDIPQGGLCLPEKGNNLPTATGSGELGPGSGLPCPSQACLGSQSLQLCVLWLLTCLQHPLTTNCSQAPRSQQVCPSYSVENRPGEGQVLARGLLPQASYCCSVTKWCPILCDPNDCSAPGFLLAQCHLQGPKAWGSGR